jgi:hypothetical protein
MQRLQFQLGTNIKFEEFLFYPEKGFSPNPLFSGAPTLFLPFYNQIQCLPVQRALFAVREDQKSDRLKKKLAEVAEADGKDEDGEDTDIKDGVNRRRQVQCEV